MDDQPETSASSFPEKGTEALSSEDHDAADGLGHPVERSLTIGRPPEALYEQWLGEATLPRITAHFATVQPSGDGRMRWAVEGPLGRRFTWDTEIVDDPSGEGVSWRSMPGADVPNEGSVRFRTAPAGRGSVATLRFRFDPPAGVLGEAATKLMGHAPLNLAAEGVLRRFKSLVETGEIPTLERQPAAREDPT